MKLHLTFLASFLISVLCQAQFSIPTTPATRDVLRSATVDEVRSKIKAPGFTTSIATLTALTGASKTNIVHVQGYFLANDGGGGEFLWVPASTAATNMGSIFVPDGQSTATAGRWERLFTGGSIDCRMWGVMGFGIVDESGRFQNLIDYVKVSSTKQRKITIPSAHNIKLDFPLVIGTTAANAVGWSFTSHIAIEGEVRAIGGVTSVPRFTVTGTNQVGILAQYLRGITFKNFSIEGRNLYGGQVPDMDARHNENNFVLIGAGLSTNRYSPHAGIVIDPFSSTVPVGERYAGLDAFYDAGTPYGGSSRVLFEGVNFQSFVVGAVVSASTTTLNAEEIDFVRCTFAANKDGVAFTQSQTKANTITDCRFAGGHTAITTLGYGGAGSGAAPNVTGGDFVVLYQIIKASASSGGFTMRGVFAEDFVTIGYSVAGSLPGQMSFIGCDFRVSGLYAAPEYMWQSSTPVTFKGCNFRQSGQFPFSFYGASLNTTMSPISFDDCNFTQQEEVNTGVHKEFMVSNSETLPGNNNVTHRRLIFRNCRVFKGNNKTVHLDSFNTPAASLSDLNGKMVIPGTTITVGGVTYKTSDVPPPSVSYSITSPTHVTGSGVGSFTVTTATANRFKIGDAVRNINGQTWPNGPTKNFAYIYIGYVTAISGNVVSLAGVPWSMATDFGNLTAAGAYVEWIPRFHEPTTGTVTSGSSTISSLSLNPTTVWFVGDRISGTGIPPGSYITAVTSTEITINTLATATASGVNLSDLVYSKVLDTGTLAGLGAGYLKTSSSNGVVTLTADSIPPSMASSGGSATNATLMTPVNFVDSGGTNIGSVKSNVWTFGSTDAAAGGQAVTMTVAANALTFARTGSTGLNDVSITSGFRNVNLPSMQAGTGGGLTVNAVAFAVNAGLPTSILGGLRVATATKTANYTWVRDADNTLFVDSTSGNVTITLPGASSTTGRQMRIIRTDASANTVTVTVGGGVELINGATTITLVTQYQVREFISNGTQYFTW